MKKGYPPIVLKKTDRKKYYSCLRSADQGNLAPFARMIAGHVEEALMTYLSVFGRDDELIPLKELAAKSPYSQEYLSLRARQGKLAAVKIDRTWHSSRAALKEYIGKS